jgi:DNA repair exonuclease SbcCD ATPase subunit
MEQPQQDLSTLLDELQDLRQRNKALEKKVRYLERLLSERFEKTRTDYEKLKPYFDSMKSKVMDIFFDNFPARLNYDQLIELFRARHPQISTAHLPRRIKEMCQEGRLSRSYDEETGKVVFHLKLMPIDDTKKREDFKLTGENKDV